MLRRQKVLGHDKQMEALEVRNKHLVEYIEDLERDLAGRMAEQVLLRIASGFSINKSINQSITLFIHGILITKTEVVF